VAGLVAGWAGLAVSWLAANGLGVRSNPVVAVAEQLIRRLPGSLIEQGIQRLGHHDKPVFETIELVVLTVIFALLGLVLRRSVTRAAIGWLVLAAIGGLAVAGEPDAGAKGQLPVLAGFVVWVGASVVLTDPLRAPAEPDDGRRFALRAAAVVVGAGIVGLAAPWLGRSRRAVEAERATLTLPGVTPPQVPKGADLGLAQPWATPTNDFYRVDTTFVPPAVGTGGWQLRIHGMVDHPITLTFEDLLARQRTQAWITLNCVSNEVGGDLIGNAWWSGVRLAPLLAEAGVQAGADAVLQTSADGWTCGTPLSTLTDGRNAMLAVAMNGAPLPIDHGFPVRTLVPGLFGYVSACKWVVDLEVTTMEKAVGYWIPLGWSVQGPVKLASRIDRPRDGQSVPAGRYTMAGVAWEQETGIAKVQVSVDGGPWQECRLAKAVDIDTWVQWSCDVDLASGAHRVAVRAVDKAGNVQTAVRRGVLPDGATGWHTVTFTAS